VAEKVLSDRQQEIVETTMRLVFQKGMQELTMKKIAQEIGITEPALYRHFLSKADILLALVEVLNGKRQGIIRDTEKAGPGLRAFLEAFFVGHARLFAAQPAMTLILFSEELFSADSELAQRVHIMMEGTIGLLRDRIAGAVSGGEIRKDRDPFTSTLLLVGGFRLLVSLWRMERHDFDLEARSRLFLDEAVAQIGL
jgi:AcrR family transcriptional regulator